MARKLPRYTYCERSRHGTPRYYFRRGKGERIRLHGSPSSPEFEAAYRAALIGEPLQTGMRAAAHDPRSLRWLIDRYKESAAWKQLSDRTRYQRDKLFAQAATNAGHQPFSGIDRDTLEAAMDARADTPAQANSFLKAMRGLFDWALRNKHVDSNPCDGVERLKDKTDGFPAWTKEDVVAYREKHPIGTLARLAMEFMLLTGLRRHDMATVGRQHIKNGVLSMKTQKTGAQITIHLPQYLLDIIDASPNYGMHLIAKENGMPYTVESFGNSFRDWCREAGVKKSAHGLRKLSATMAAEGGAAAHQLMAQYGWTNISQAEVYTKGADRVRLGIENSRVVAGQIENIQTPHPDLVRGKRTLKR